MMKRPRLEMTDLPSDIVKDIVIRVAKSRDGAADVARLISTYKTMYEFVEDIDVLKAVCFDRLVVSEHFESLQKYESLVTRCAAKGNPKALFLLAEVVLMTASKIVTDLDEERAPDLRSMAYMIALFLDMLRGREVDGSELHINAVRVFLHACSPSQLSAMRTHLENYLERFVLFSRVEHEDFYNSIDILCRSVSFERFFDRMERRGRDTYETVTGKKSEVLKLKTKLDDLFFSMEARVEMLGELSKWSYFRVPRLDQSGVASGCSPTVIDDFKLIAVNFDFHRLVAIAALDDAFPLLGT